MERRVETKVGTLYARAYKNSQPEPVNVELSEDRLVVRRHDVVYEDVLANNEIVNERDVQLERSENGVGFSIQGGLDYKCPIKIYKIFENSPAERCGQIEERDILIEVNGISLWGKTHDEAADILKNAGKHINLHIGKLQLREIEEQVNIEAQWIAMSETPLKMASVSRYHKGTAILSLMPRLKIPNIKEGYRPNVFQVQSKDGKSKANLHCDDHTPNQLSEWVTAITQRIRDLNKLEIEAYNAPLERNEKIVQMGWVHEHIASTTHTKAWQRKFVVLKKLKFQIFDSVPETVGEWLRPENSYRLLEMTVKVLNPHQFTEQRANTVIITSGTGPNHIISFETRDEIILWTRALHTTTVEAVNYIEKQQYLGQWKSQSIYFILDLKKGFVICNRNDLTEILWQKPFSCLRNSTDNGHKNLRLEFNVKDSQLTEVQHIELEDLQIAVCAIECFMAAKVAQLDPDFIMQQPDLQLVA